MKFGLVGLGQMGAPMAINLATKNDVLIYDRNTDAVAKVVRSVAKAASYCFC